MLVPLVACVVLCVRVSGGEVWDGGASDDNWGTAKNWKPDGVPGTIDAVQIPKGFTVYVNGAFSCASLELNTGAGGISHLNFSGTNPSLEVSGRVDIGDTTHGNRAGVLTFTSDATLSAGSLYLNKNLSGSTSSEIDMTAGGRLVTGSLNVGGAHATAAIWTPGVGTVELTAGNPLPSSVFTSFYNLNINHTTVGTTTLGTATTINAGGTLSLTSGTLDAATSLTMTAGSSITRSGGAMTGTIQGADAYDVSYTGSTKTTGPELSGSGLRNMTAGLGSGQVLTLDQHRSLAGTLTVSGGAFTVGQELTVTGDTTVSGGLLDIGLLGTFKGDGQVTIAGGGFSCSSSTALAKTVSFSGTGGTLNGTGTIIPAVTVTSGNFHSAGSLVRPGSPTATLGTATFTGGITYSAGSIFEWNLTANTDTSIGTRGVNYDAVNAGLLATTGGGAEFRVVLDGSQNFSESFWDTNREWTGIIKNIGETSDYDLAAVFSNFQYYNSAGQVSNVPSTQGHFSFTNGGTTLQWTVVPEPTAALSGMLLAAGLLRRRR